NASDGRVHDRNESRYHGRGALRAAARRSGFRRRRTPCRRPLRRCNDRRRPDLDSRWPWTRRQPAAALAGLVHPRQPTNTGGGAGDYREFMSEMHSTESSPTPNPDGGKYVYCIVRSDRQRDFGAIGIGGGQRVFTVAYQDLAAVVSDTPIVIYDPTRDNVLAHEFVNETVMREHTVIPMSFGTVFRSEDDVTELLRSTYQAFSDVLDKMQDKIEFGLKVLWDRDKVVANLERENDEIRRLKDEISRHTTSSTYFARMQLGRLIESALEEIGTRYVADIHDALKPVAVASRS